MLCVTSNYTKLTINSFNQVCTGNVHQQVTLAVIYRVTHSSNKTLPVPNLLPLSPSTMKRLSHTYLWV